LFAEPQYTQFDLKWRMFGVPVRVHPLFWLVSALFGWDLIRYGLQYVMLWIGCVFLSILVHEFGHVLVGQLFGSRGYIILYGMGGLAVGSSDLRNRWKRVGVLFAGPLAGFLLFGLTWVIARQLQFDEGPSFKRAALGFLLEINLFWGLLNLLPIWPLDGGRISREIISWLSPQNGNRAALAVSILTAGVIAGNALSLTALKKPLPLFDRIPFLGHFGGYWTVIFFGYLAFMSYQALMMERPRRPWDKGEDQW
jgi:stage IV sporulation protein FB